MQPVRLFRSSEVAIRWVATQGGAIFFSRDVSDLHGPGSRGGSGGTCPSNFRTGGQSPSNFEAPIHVENC